MDTMIQTKKMLNYTTLESQNNVRKTTLRDAIFGLAVGDALGVPYEFMERNTFKCTGMVGGGRHGKPAGTWSDDTSLTLATCDSIRLNEGRIDINDMLMRFRLFIEDGAYTIDGLFDIGNTTYRAIKDGRGRDGEYECGNGSLMRIIPLAFTNATGRHVAAVSAITHANTACIDICWEFIKIARCLASGVAPLDIPDIRSRLDRPIDSVKSSGYVCHTYDAALWCLANTSNYADCVLAAVNLGDDTDTTAAVAGALAGIVYGAESIPIQWLRCLRGRELIKRVLFKPEDIEV